MAAVTEHIAFGPYRCDPVNACLWRGEQVVSLPPKVFDVLLYLLRHPGQLVSKEELLKTLWAETSVGDAVLKVCIGEIRKALADNAKHPQFVETVQRRGYRFIARLSTTPPPGQSPRSNVQSQEKAVSGWGKSGVQGPASDVKNSQSAVRSPH